MDALFAPAFQAWGSPVTWLEIVAFGLSVAMVLCNQRQWLAGWPLSIVASALYGLLFWRGQLYGEAGLQLLFILMSVWGWWQWWRGTATHTLRVQRLRPAQWRWAIGSILLGWPLLGLLLDHATDSPLPYWDALPTVASVVTTVLVARKFIENWAFWIAINAVSVLLFALRAYWLTVILYAAFIPLAWQGWRRWQSELRPAPC